MSALKLTTLFAVLIFSFSSQAQQPPAMPPPTVEQPPAVPPPTMPSADSNVAVPPQPPAQMQPPPDIQPPAQMQPPPLAQTASIIANELVFIKPYFRNKKKLGRMTAELTHLVDQSLIATLQSDFGDCQGCARGASIKSKIGIRLYGDSMNKLRISRKSSVSIKVTNCPSQADLSVPFVTCEFTHKQQPYRLTIKLEP